MKKDDKVIPPSGVGTARGKGIDKPSESGDQWSAMKAGGKKGRVVCLC